MTNLSWAYIAGFFDGEGCIQRHVDKTHGGDRLAVTITQKEDRDLVLWKIAVWLETRGIACNVFTTRTNHPDGMSRLHVLGGGAGILKFLTKIKPWLRVKHAEAEAMIEYLEGKQLRGPGRPRKELVR